ncbi:cache domain-containing sensor histidine kinase [Cellulosilyticum sp. I15G10I2]|uniref:cache domain-containing sensor histidine kinase n=1 Tax=Cellulosilyticum sp. I15G10I2 TaxID=1892843 RepID=UPI00085C9075|nr:histidine kinase [Cellulosilyticum sp. I15G10I2]
MQNLAKKIAANWSKMKIGNKITLYYFTLIIMSIVLSLFIYEQTNKYYMNQNIEKIGTQGIESDSRNFELFIEDINNYSKILLANQNVQQILENEDTYQLPTYRRLDRFLQEFINFNTKVSSIYVFSNSGKKYYTEKITLKSIELRDIEQMSFYEEILAKKGGFILRLNQHGLVDARKTSGISFIRVINSLQRQEKIGFLIINLDQKVLEKALGLDDQNNATIFIQNADGQTLMGYNPIEDFDEEVYFEQLEKENKFWTIFKKNHKDMMITGINNRKYGWKILKVIPFEDATEQFNVFNIGIFSIVAVNISLMLLGSFFISKLITSPIHTLMSSMKDVEHGHFKPVVMKTNEDEIGMLKNVYNFMIDEIHKLINRIIQEQKTKRKAELGIMMEQIKPHFLYNTIDSISSLIMLERSQEAYESLRALGNFYRTSLSNGRDIIPIREELETVENYIYIQKIRYRDLFEAEYDIDAEVLEVKVPRLILQPLVENSIYHGIRPSGNKGLIRISIKKVMHTVWIVVEDNGVGLSGEELINLNTTNEKSIGIPATRERIRILFGEKSCFHIESECNKGTKIRIEIPLDEEGNN